MVHQNDHNTKKSEPSIAFQAVSHSTHLLTSDGRLSNPRKHFPASSLGTSGRQHDSRDPNATEFGRPSQTSGLGERQMRSIDQSDVAAGQSELKE